ncbi:MAG: N-acetylmuramoyl-L-alanine amidase [Bacteroidia bacterium]|nr:N-acetylmuramoyl-L-alanine amidase [Bacteroidia bacterium]MCC6768021.1 N-acetylmuramoyl-L-alanine amidase [Bacteroidia bacterium]
MQQKIQKTAIFFTLGFLVTALLLLFFTTAMAADKPRKEHKLRTVVIDAGHGGHDSGCHGAAAYEKTVALAISLKLGKLIEQNYPDVKVIYTRKTDVFVELYRRAQIANENKADLFICIHCNSGPKTAFGSETFVMGLHKSDDNLNVARRENAVILKEDNYEKKYDGFDPNSPEANIIFSLYQNAFLTQSLYFAERVQHEFKTHAHRFNRGVKQAGFLVLYRTTMPSVLVETGFLTNHEEERFLRSDAGQDKMAASMLRAFSSYKSWIDGSSEPKKLIIPEIAAEPKPEDLVRSPKAQVSDTKEVNTDTSSNEVIFRVQILSSPEKISLKSRKFQDRDDVWEYKANNVYKYTVGNYSKLDDALKLQTEMKKSGYHDAFVVAFRKNQRISLQEAASVSQP